MKKHLILISILLLAIGTAACGQSDTSAAPADSTIKKIVLDNGLTVLVKPEPGSELVAISTIVRAGVPEETIMNAGTGFLVTQLLLASTVVSSADKVATIADSVGGNISAQWKPDYTELAAISTSHMFNDTMNLVAECLMQANFESTWVERTRAEVLRNIREDNSPATEKAYIKLRELLYQDNGYRRPTYGIERVIRTVTSEDLRRFHTAYYVPNNTVIAIAGDVTVEAAIERAKLAFAGWTERPLPKRLPIPDETMDMFRSYAAESHASLAYVMMGWLAPGVTDKDYAAMAIAGSVLGGGKGSRMFQRLRQELGMGYEIGSTYPRLRNQSHLMAYVATDPFKFDMRTGPEIVVDEVKTNLIKIVDEIKNTPLSEAELARAKGYTIGQFAMSHQHLAQRASDLAAFETLGLGYNMYQRFPDEIEKVTAADVQRVARTYFDKYAMVVLLPSGRSE